MRRADRLFQLVQLLRARRIATGRWLAEELGVSVRTVYRDVADLVASGVPIEGEAGVGYRLARGYELPPLTFTTSEIEALVLGVRMVEAWADPELAEAARAALRKVEAVVPGSLRRALVDTPLFVPRFGTPGDVEARLSLLRQAIGQRTRVRTDYVRADGTPSERTICPVGLYFWGDRWSVAAWCELRQDWRSFRPDRMESLVPLEDSFAHRPEISLPAFIEALEATEGVPPRVVRELSGRRR